MQIATINDSGEMPCAQCSVKIASGDVYIDLNDNPFCSHACADEWEKDMEQAKYETHPRHGGA